MSPSFRKVALDSENCVYLAELPHGDMPSEARFEEFWQLHPPDFYDVEILGKRVKTPRWQQAYNKTYQYTGSRNQALPVPGLLQPYWDWCRQEIDSRLNGLLLNWYDGRLGHYIGKHRDSTVNMIEGAPIVTVSFREHRTFRLRPWRGSGYTDFTVRNGSVVVVPYDTNQTWTHEVPASKKLKGRRISLTIRAFD